MCFFDDIKTKRNKYRKNVPKKLYGDDERDEFLNGGTMRLLISIQRSFTIWFLKKNRSKVTSSSFME